MNNRRSSSGTASVYMLTFPFSATKSRPLAWKLFPKYHSIHSLELFLKQNVFVEDLYKLHQKDHVLG
jgi:hypothetical protein